MLLYNNRWICLLPFARKPDPRRVSKQVSREPPQAWLFGLVRLAPQAERKAPQAERKAPQASQLRLARRRPEFFGQAHERCDLQQLPCSPRSDLAHAALNSAAAQAPVAHELVKEQAFHKLLQMPVMSV